MDQAKIRKEEFYTNHLNQIETSESNKYGIYSEKYEEEEGFTEKFRINYSYEGVNGEKYNNIYTILKGDKGIEFKGVYSVP